MTYWFHEWMRKHKLSDEQRLRSFLEKPEGLATLQSAAPPPVLPETSSMAGTTLTAGKGIDLTGGLGCRDIACLKSEIDGLFRHMWHYFDRVTLPDEALGALVTLEARNDLSLFSRRLVPFAEAVRHLHVLGGDVIDEVVSFEPRRPGCSGHFEQHAQEAGISQAIVNTAALVREIAATADVRWQVVDEAGHVHVQYGLVDSAFEHTEWGSLCSNHEPIPPDEQGLRQAIAERVVKRYLAELSADAYAARATKSCLGSTIPFYRKLLAVELAPAAGDVAFELALPIAEGLSTAQLIDVRRAEKPAFERFQRAMRTAIEERIQRAEEGQVAGIANEIKRDVIDPELRGIRDRLSVATKMTNRSGLTGVALGAATAVVGLLSPLVGPQFGTGLAVAGAVATIQAFKKSMDDLLSARKDVSLSDMYFLWQAHRH